MASINRQGKLTALPADVTSKLLAFLVPTPPPQNG
jgi:hypothetical protein